MIKEKLFLLLTFVFTLTLFSCDSGSDVEDVSSTDPVIIPPETPPSTAPNKPNILLIIADDQGLDASAQYSYSSNLPHTPSLNALAEQGITFDNVWATPACTTTRGTIITGQHGVKSGIDFVPAKMSIDTQTLQRYIKSQTVSSDYLTAVIGKWHLGGSNPELSHPTDSGVDYYAGTIAGTIDDYYHWQLTENASSADSSEYHTTKITDLAIEWLNEQHQQENPWFLWLAYAAPHAPFHLPPEHLHNRDSLTGSQEDIDANKREYYLAAIEAMDTEIGRLLNSMTTQERENTVILYIGDNGTPAGVIDTSVFAKEHSKGSLYEGGIRVPMIVSGYGVNRKNERETALINTTDFFASIANIAGSSLTKMNDSYDFTQLFNSPATSLRKINYSEFSSNEVTGWVVRNEQHKLIEQNNGNQELFDISDTIAESEDIRFNNTTLANELLAQAMLIRNEPTMSAVDITNVIFINRSGNCADYVEHYQSTVFDVNNSALFDGDLVISLLNDKCLFQTNNVPNHDFNDGGQAFPNNVSTQDNHFEIAANPSHASSVTAISLQTDNAIMLNGVKVDLLAAACFGVGDGKVGCNDSNQSWRYDPMFIANGFRVDSHNAHSQPDGSYHYHGKPNAFYDNDSQNTVSPVVGFAADGYPIFGPYIEAQGVIRKATSSFRLRSGNRPTDVSSPSGSYDGTYRDDYEYVAGYGDLDECNGMSIEGVYGYYISDGFPYILTCFKGTPDISFNK